MLVKKMKNLLRLIIIFLITQEKCTKQFVKEETRGWESICSILSCKPVLENCIRTNCIGKENCRNCVQNENEMCLRCVDGLINEENYLLNGNKTIICDSVNSLHLTTCNFYCRMKELLSWTCEQLGGYPLCNCKSSLMTTSLTTTTIITTTTMPDTTITTATPSTTTKKPLGSLIGKNI